jgi:hypothetical protein
LAIFPVSRGRVSHFLAGIFILAKVLILETRFFEKTGFLARRKNLVSGPNHWPKALGPKLATVGPSRRRGQHGAGPPNKKNCGDFA